MGRFHCLLLNLSLHLLLLHNSFHFLLLSLIYDPIHFGDLLKLYSEKDLLTLALILGTILTLVDLLGDFPSLRLDVIHSHDLLFRPIAA